MESYEVQGVAYDQKEDICAAISQVVNRDWGKSDLAFYGMPSDSFRVKFFGEDEMRLIYHSYEINLHERFEEISDFSNKALNEIEKLIKREYKKLTKKTLKLKEKKKARDFTVEKVSLNLRYYFVTWREYNIS